MTKYHVVLSPSDDVDPGAVSRTLFEAVLVPRPEIALWFRQRPGIPLRDLELPVAEAAVEILQTQHAISARIIETEGHLLPPEIHRVRSVGHSGDTWELSFGHELALVAPEDIAALAVTALRRPRPPEKKRKDRLVESRLGRRENDLGPAFGPIADLQEAVEDEDYEFETATFDVVTNDGELYAIEFETSFPDRALIEGESSSRLNWLGFVRDAIDAHRERFWPGSIEWIEGRDGPHVACDSRVVLDQKRLWIVETARLSSDSPNENSSLTETEEPDL